MTIKLYELVGKDPAKPFSPHCWKARLALAHKDLEFEAIPVRFTEIPDIENGGQTKVPVIRHGERLVEDSFVIAEYLRDAYPDRGKKLFYGDGQVALTHFVDAWSLTQLAPWVAKWALLDIHALLDEKDQAYFRESREKRFGKTLEDVVANREDRLPELKTHLTTLEIAMRDRPFLCGREPGYADYIVFSFFQWLRLASGLDMIEAGKTREWIDRCLDLHGGMARSIG